MLSCVILPCVILSRFVVSVSCRAVSYLVVLYFLLWLVLSCLVLYFCTCLVLRTMPNVLLESGPVDDDGIGGLSMSNSVGLLSSTTLSDKKNVSVRGHLLANKCPVAHIGEKYRFDTPPHSTTFYYFGCVQCMLYFLWVHRFLFLVRMG